MLFDYIKFNYLQTIWLLLNNQSYVIVINDYTQVGLIKVKDHYDFITSKNVILYT